MSEFLEIALQAALLSQEIILEHYNSSIKTQYKEDHSPVTIADKKAEQIIRETIEKTFPDHGFLGEEYGKDHFEKEYVWIIDPIDGTKKFRRQIPFFATEIALMKGNEVIVGVSNAPALSECVYAEKGSGAYIKRKGVSSKDSEKIHVSNITKLSDAFIQHEGLKHFVRNDFLQPLLEISENNMGFGGIGDAWVYHLLATGKVDVIIGADCHAWDYAPFACIIDEAGGKVTDIQGKSFSRDIKTILATNGFLHNDLVKAFTTNT